MAVVAEETAEDGGHDNNTQGTSSKTEGHTASYTLAIDTLPRPPGIDDHGAPASHDIPGVEALPWAGQGPEPNKGVDSDVLWPSMGGLCPICEKPIKGGRWQLRAHQLTSSRCLAASGKAPHAREACEFCGKPLAAGDAWAKFQHRQNCPQQPHATTDHQKPQSSTNIRPNRSCSRGAKRRGHSRQPERNDPATGGQEDWGQWSRNSRYNQGHTRGRSAHRPEQYVQDSSTADINEVADFWQWQQWKNHDHNGQGNQQPEASNHHHRDRRWGDQWAGNDNRYHNWRHDQQEKVWAAHSRYTQREPSQHQYRGQNTSVQRHDDNEWHWNGWGNHHHSRTWHS